MTVRHLSTLVLFTSKVPELLLFYRALGFALTEDRKAGPGSMHYACDVGALHFAIYEAEGGNATPTRKGGSEMIGFEVGSLSEVHQKLMKLGAVIEREPEQKPWGKRMLAIDPDGRMVEINENRQMH